MRQPLSHRTASNAKPTFLALVPLALAVILASTGPASAQTLVVDQENDPATGTSYSAPGSTVGQGFTPTTSFLAAIDLRLRVGGAFPSPGFVSTMVVREGGINGLIIASATTFVPPTANTGQQILVRYDIAQATTPGTLYVIEWDSPAASTLTWMGTDTDPYPGGSMYGGSGNLVATRDFNFITYTDATAPNFIRGDCSTDGATNLADAVQLLNHLFPQGTPATLDCDDACDFNDDGALNLQDPIQLMNWLFVPTSPAPAPPLSCGLDTTADALDCAAFGSC